MDLVLGESHVGMERDQLIAVRGAKGGRVCCLDGTLWITQERLPVDVLLESGQCVDIETRGLTLVMALRPSAVRLHDGVSRLHAWWSALAGWLQPGAARASRAH